MEAERKGRGDCPGVEVKAVAVTKSRVPRVRKRSGSIRAEVGTASDEASTSTALALRAIVGSNRLLATFQGLMEGFSHDPSEEHLQRALDEIDDVCKVWRRGRREDLFLARAVGCGLLESRANQQLYALLREWGEPSYMEHASALKVVLDPGGDA